MYFKGDTQKNDTFHTCKFHLNFASNKKIKYHISSSVVSVSDLSFSKKKDCEVPAMVEWIKDLTIAAQVAAEVVQVWSWPGTVG